MSGINRNSFVIRTDKLKAVLFFCVLIVSLFINKKPYSIEWDAFLLPISLSCLVSLIHCLNLVNGKKTYDNYVIYTLIMYIFAVMISSLFGGKGIFNTSVINCVFFFIIIFASKYMGKYDCGETVEKIYLFFCVLFASMIIFNFLAGNSMNGDGRNYTVIMFNVKKDPNYLNSVMLPGIALAWDRIISTDKRFTKLFYGLFVGLIIVGSMITGERAGLLAILVCIVYVTALSTIKEKKYGMLFITITMCILAYYVFTNVLDTAMSDRMQVLFDASTLKRIEAWKTAFNIFLTSPIYGAGYNAGTEATLLSLHTNTHNAFVDLLCEQGLVGVSLFIAIIVNTRRFYYKRIKFDMYFLLAYIPLFFVNGLNGAHFFFPIIMMFATNRYHSKELITVK